MGPVDHGVGNRNFDSRKSARSLAIATLIAISAVILTPGVSVADEDGVSFWLPGQFGSLAAVPQGQPGWALGLLNYFDSVSASGAVAAAREITIGKLSATVTVNLNVNVKANLDLVFLNPSYTFATPVFGGQLTLGMTGLAGYNDASLNGTITAGVGPFTVTKTGSIGDSVVGVGDLYPQAMLRWNNGVNNWMTYLTGDIPVGAYSPTDLANLGIGHGAIDGGGGYTYLNPETGHEFSVVTGLTYNLVNPSTNYQNGVDWHLDWGASQFMSKQFFVGAVGYVYDQISADSGAGDLVGPFESRVIGVGPQVGYIFPVGNMQGYLNLKGYGEFDANDRPSGFSLWLTFAVSPAAPAPPTASAPVVYK